MEGLCHLNSTVVSHNLSFPEEQCVILVQSSKVLPCDYKPFAKFATPGPLRREGRRAVAMGMTSFSDLLSGFPCSPKSRQGLPT